MDEFIKNLTSTKTTGKQTKVSWHILVSELVDQIYKKERQYTKNYDKDNILNGRSPIFDLQKFYNLKSHTGVETTFTTRPAQRQDISTVPS